MPETYQSHVNGAPSVSPVLQAGMIDYGRAISEGMGVGIATAEAHQRAAESAVRVGTELALLPSRLQLMEAQAQQAQGEVAMLPEKLKLIKAEANLNEIKAGAARVEAQYQQGLIDSGMRLEQDTLTLETGKQALATARFRTRQAKLEFQRQQTQYAREETDSLGMQSALGALAAQYGKAPATTLDDGYKAIIAQFPYANEAVKQQAGLAYKAFQTKTWDVVTGYENNDLNKPIHAEISTDKFLDYQRGQQAYVAAGGKLSDYTLSKHISQNAYHAAEEAKATEIGALQGAGFAEPVATMLQGMLAAARRTQLQSQASAAGFSEFLRGNPGAVVVASGDTMPEEYLANPNAVSYAGATRVSDLFEYAANEIKNGNADDTITLASPYGPGRITMTYADLATATGSRLLSSMMSKQQAELAENTAALGNMSAPVNIPVLAARIGSAKNWVTSRPSSSAYAASLKNMGTVMAAHAEKMRVAAATVGDKAEEDRWSAAATFYNQVAKASWNSFTITGNATDEAYGGLENATKDFGWDADKTGTMRSIIQLIERRHMQSADQGTYGQAEYNDDTREVTRRLLEAGGILNSQSTTTSDINRINGVLGNLSRARGISPVLGSTAPTQTGGSAQPAAGANSGGATFPK